jgi:hypothetical protein
MLAKQARIELAKKRALEPGIEGDLGYPQIKKDTYQEALQKKLQQHAYVHDQLAAQKISINQRKENERKKEEQLDNEYLGGWVNKSEL